MTRPTTNTFVSSREAAKHFSRQQDDKILRLRAGGMSFADIAIAFPGRTPLSIRRRHQRLTFTPQSAPTPVEAGDDGVLRQELREASDALLHRQIATGQFNAAQRAAWVAKHGGSGVTDAPTLARTQIKAWPRDRLHASDADQQAMRSFGLNPSQAAAIITGERKRRP